MDLGVVDAAHAGRVGHAPLDRRRRHTVDLAVYLSADPVLLIRRLPAPRNRHATAAVRSGSPVSSASARPVVSCRPSGTSPGSPSRPRGIVGTSASSYFRSPPGDTRADCSSADRDQTMRSLPLDLLFEANAQPKAPRSFRWRCVCLGARSRAATRITPPSGPCVGAVRERTTELNLPLA